jgi:hypothetical protein
MPEKGCWDRMQGLAMVTLLDFICWNLDSVDKGIVGTKVSSRTKNKEVGTDRVCD